MIPLRLSATIQNTRSKRPRLRRKARMYPSAYWFSHFFKDTVAIANDLAGTKRCDGEMSLDFPVEHLRVYESPQLPLWYDMVYLLTVIGMSPGGSSTVHIYTQTIHRTIQKYIEQHNFGRVPAVPRLGELYPGICLTTEEKARKNLSQGSRV